jgi:hypothetical protein
MGARPSALGAYTAAADDINSLYWNPGGLSFLRKRELGVSHTELYGEARLESLGYGHPTRWGTFAASLSYLGQGRIESRDSQGLQTGDYAASDRLFVLGYGIPVGRFGLGMSAKVIQQQIAETTASGFAADLGAGYRPNRFLKLGFSVLNLGPGLSGKTGTSQLPLTMSGGAALRVIPQFMISADVRHRFLEKKSSFGLGFEAEVYNGLLLRAGYLAANGSMAAGSSMSALSRVTAGFGVRLKGYAVDYAFAPAGHIGSTQRLSLGLKF